MTQLDLFDGSTFNAARDGARLFAQLADVRGLMLDGIWRTLPDIAASLNHPPASVSARLRDLRKPKFGAHIVERRYIARGLYEYRLKTGADSMS